MRLSSYTEDSREDAKIAKKIKMASRFFSQTGQIKFYIKAKLAWSLVASGCASTNHLNPSIFGPLYLRMLFLMRDWNRASE
jgi:hypothetical protein